MKHIKMIVRCVSVLRLKWVRRTTGLLLLPRYRASAALQSSALTWTHQPSHVRLCLRSPCVAAHWPSGVVTYPLHNSSRHAGVGSVRGYTWGVSQRLALTYFSRERTCLLHVGACWKKPSKIMVHSWPLGFTIVFVSCRPLVEKCFYGWHLVISFYVLII